MAGIIHYIANSFLKGAYLFDFQIDGSGGEEYVEGDKTGVGDKEGKGDGDGGGEGVDESSIVGATVRVGENVGVGVGRFSEMTVTGVSMSISAGSLSVKTT